MREREKMISWRVSERERENDILESQGEREKMISWRVRERVEGIWEEGGGGGSSRCRMARPDSSLDLSWIRS